MQTLIEPHHRNEMFRAPDVCGFTGITFRQLDYWIRNQYLSPSVQAHGSGSQRMFSRVDVLHICLLKTLLDAGIALQRAFQSLQVAMPLTEDQYAGMNLVTQTEAFLVTDSDLMDHIARNVGSVHVLPLGPLQQKLEGLIHEPRPQQLAS